MAKGIVSVTPGIKPAIINVAPNSPNARAKVNTKPESKPGQARGKEIVQNTRQREAPRVSAAFSTFWSYCLKAAVALWYISGKETTTAARTTAYHVKTI